MSIKQITDMLVDIGAPEDEQHIVRSTSRLATEVITLRSRLSAIHTLAVDAYDDGVGTRYHTANVALARIISLSVGAQ